MTPSATGRGSPLPGAVLAGRSTAAIDRVTGRQRAVRARVLTEALGVDASMVQAQL